MTTHKRMHDIPLGSTLSIKRIKRTAWSWSLNIGEKVELVEIQRQPIQFKVKDSLNRIWMLNSFDLVSPSQKILDTSVMVKD